MFFSHLQRPVWSNGFEFCSIVHPIKVRDAIIVRNPSDADAKSPRLAFSRKSLKEHIEFINSNNIEKARIFAEDIAFIDSCKSLRYVDLIPADSAADKFAFSPIYTLPNLCHLGCKTKYGVKEEKHSQIDFERLGSLVSLYAREIDSLSNMNVLPNLRTLKLNNSSCKCDDLTAVFSSKYLDLLSLGSIRIKSLKGIGASKKLVQVNLSYNRSLADISDLYYVRDTLKLLSIECCPKIVDFSVLEELNNLEYLELCGSNTLPSLHFVDKLPKLKSLTFSMKVANGDLSPCLRLQYAGSEKNRKEYNLHDKELPKGFCGYQPEDYGIETWRKL